ncbi:MAG: sigma 54-interacting transcriptional regulator [Deltaproteobacteria bacterium]|nr:sigma 54-interacting transcriptional regulator [Deltaproteobacteria bacterium]
MECSRLGARPSRHALKGVTNVALGRGSRREHERKDDSLAIRLPDRWMSSKHAKLSHSFGRWILEDEGSKNGTAVNGTVTTRANLKDGDLIEVGHSILLYREVNGLGGELDHIAEPESQPVGLTTVVPEFEATLTDLKRVATAADIRVLLLGESGTGKEVLARAIHELSGRAGEFVAVNCGALPANLVESELFGHKKGAFSGADTDRPGLVRAADGGTLFLDEIGDLPGSSQAALLRVLQESEVMPVGATKPVPVDIRLISATHRDIDRMVERGQFRHDLYARISGFRMSLPALRQRREDIGMLSAHFLSVKLGGQEGLDSYPGLDVAAALKLVRYPWPLNIRELESSLTTAYVLAGKGPIETNHLPEQVRRGADEAPKVAEGATLSETTMPPLSAEDQQLRAQVIDKLRQHEGNISAVARDMGKDRKQIQRWVKRFQLDPKQFKGE